MYCYSLACDFVSRVLIWREKVLSLSTEVQEVANNWNVYFQRVHLSKFLGDEIEFVSNSVNK